MTQAFLTMGLGAEVIFGKKKMADKQYVIQSMKPDKISY